MELKATSLPVSQLESRARFVFMYQSTNGAQRQRLKQGNSCDLHRIRQFLAAAVALTRTNYRCAEHVEVSRRVSKGVNLIVLNQKISKMFRRERSDRNSNHKLNGFAHLPALKDRKRC